MPNWLRTRYVIYGIVLLALVGAWQTTVWVYEKEARQNLKKAEADRRLAEHLKLEQDEEFNPGWSGQAALQNLRDALNADPSRMDIRRKLFLLIDERRGHAGGSDEMRELLMEGEKYRESYEPEEYQGLLRLMASYSTVIGEDRSFQRTKRREAVEAAPYTKWAIEKRLGWAEDKARQAEEGALEYLEATRDRVREYGDRTGKDVEKKLLYLDYLEGVYWRETGNKKKAATEFYEVLEKLDFAINARIASNQKSAQLFFEVRDLYKDIGEPENAREIMNKFNESYQNKKRN